jgi:serine/threonine-protein kinase
MDRLSYQRDTSEILAVEQEIVSAIAQAIHGRVAAESSPGGGPEGSGSKPPVDHVAHELYLKARHLWNQRTPQSVHAAVGFFERAIDRQPRYALAHAGLAHAYIVLGAMAEMTPSEAYSRARLAASTALEIDPALPEAHTALAAILGEYDWKWADAETHFRQALTVSPSYATAQHWYSDYLMFMGRTDEAVRAASAAHRVDPLSPIVNTNLGMQLLRVGRFDEAVAQIRQTFELFPDFHRGYVPLGLAQTHQRKFTDAIAAFERFRALAGETPDALGLLGYAQARAGDQVRAREALATLDRLARTRHVPAYERAVIYVGLDDRDAAFEWLERAVSAREWLVLLLNVDPIFEPIRSDTRFGPLVAKVGLPR